MSGILQEADEIVNGARATDYGDARESFEKIADVANLLLDSQEKGLLMAKEGLCAEAVCKVMMAVKLVRQSNKHKRDNLVDLCGYAELLNRLQGE